MLKKILLLSLISINLLFAETSFFKQNDKQKHFAVGTVISMISAPILKKEFDLSLTESYWAGVAISLLAGLGKEVYDSRPNGTGFNGKDILATGLGGAVGASTTFFIYKF